MASRYQRAGAIGGRFRASDLQKAIARQTILETRPWKRRSYTTAIVLSSLPSTTAIEALYSRHGFKAIATASISNEGYLVSVVIEQRKDFSLNDTTQITQILEDFKNG